MSDITYTEIDFDEWAELAQSDPEAFEARRKALIEATIDQAPEARQQRLRGLQWQIDQVRRVSSTPMGACVRISEMMWDTVMGPDGLLESLERLGQVAEGGEPDVKPQMSATILPMNSHMQGSNCADSVHQGRT